MLQHPCTTTPPSLAKWLRVAACYSRCHAGWARGQNHGRINTALDPCQHASRGDAESVAASEASTYVVPDSELSSNEADKVLSTNGSGARRVLTGQLCSCVHRGSASATQATRYDYLCQPRHDV